MKLQTMKLRDILPWAFAPLFLCAVYATVMTWEQAGHGTAIFITLTAGVLLFAVRSMLRHGGLCRDAQSSALVLIPFCALILVRLSVFDYITLDYENFLSPWVQFYRENGGFAGLGTAQGNYNVPYLTWLALFSYFPIFDLYLIKLLSLIFDAVLAYFLFKLASLLTDSPGGRVVCFLTAMVLPTVILNGAVWGQCDSIYAAFCAGALYFALREPKTMKLRRNWVRINSIVAYAFAAIALSYKLQAIFVMPVIIPLLIAKKVRLKYLWVFPAVYIISVSPALLAGRGFIDTLTIYISEAGSVGDGLNYNSPSFFALRWNWPNPDMWASLGLVAAAAVCALAAYLAYFNRKRLTTESLMTLACILAVGVPLFLPHMHDRYFVLADVLILPLAIKKVRRIPLVVMTGFASVLGYYAYLRMQWLLTMNYGFYALVIVFAALVAEFVLENRTR
jgi:Gpi18-like mannosyltransferase